MLWGDRVLTGADLLGTAGPWIARPAWLGYHAFMSKKTVNQKNLEALGARQLAALVLELGEGDRGIKRRVRLELTHAAGGGELAKEVRKRLATIARSRSFIDWDKVRAFVKDLDTQLEMITDKVAPDAPAEAFDLLWQFIEMAPSIHERVDDSRGDVGDVFHFAMQAFDDIAPQAKQDGAVLADRIFAAISDNGYGQWDELIAHVGPALGKDGIARLKSLITDHAAGPMPKDPSLKDRAIPLSGGRVGYKLDRDWPATQRQMRVRGWLQEIADLEGDVDAFLAEYTAEDLLNPVWAAAAASRLTGVGRADEALGILTRARDASKDGYMRYEWDKAYVATLEALGHADTLHEFRWEKFKATLSVDYLRDLLKAMPDFEDVEKEDEAKAIAMRHRHFSTALGFFLEWPDLVQASDLVITRADELDGNAYYTLTPAAEKLEADHVLASVLCRRAMIRYTLDQAKSTRNKHAIKHMAACKSADASIEDYGPFPDHAGFTDELRNVHPRKAGFWSGVE